MRAIAIFSLLLGFSVNAQQPAPLGSCLSYEMNLIDKDTGEFVLKNVFAPQLFDNLEDMFPDHKIDWTAWQTSVSEYEGDDGKDKTMLKGCFDVTKIHDNSDLISSIMRVAMTRFQAAMKFYSKPNSEHVPKEKIDSMLDGYEGLLKDSKVKEAIENELEHNK